MEGEDLILESSWIGSISSRETQVPILLVFQEPQWELNEAGVAAVSWVSETTPRWFSPQPSSSPKPMSIFSTMEFKSQTGQNLLCLSGSSVGTSRNSLWKCKFALYYSGNKTDMAALSFLWNITHFNSNLNDTIHVPSLISASSWIPSLWSYSLQYNPSVKGRARRVPLPTRSVPCWLHIQYNHDAVGGWSSPDAG